MTASNPIQLPDPASLSAGLLPTLHPRFADPAVTSELRARWAATRRMRIEDALVPGLADELAEAACEHPFGFFEKHVSEVRAVFWRQLQGFPEASVSPWAALAKALETPSFRPIEKARRLFQVDLPALVSAVTGQALHASGGNGIAIDYYTRGSYLDAHTDQGADRLIAYVVGLTRDVWPAEDGGHLEFLAPDEVTVVDRVAPGWGTLDLFCIYPLLRPHRVPLLKRSVTRLSINGWLAGELKGPGEE